MATLALMRIVKKRSQGGGKQGNGKQPRHDGLD
jgi:hypothetical protein